MQQRKCKHIQAQGFRRITKHVALLSLSYSVTAPAFCRVKILQHPELEKLETQDTIPDGRNTQNIYLNT